MVFVALDVESRLIEAGRLDPDLVCVSECSEDLEPKLYHHNEAGTEERLLQLWTDPDVVVVGANFAYDAAVLIRRYPSLLEPVFNKYLNGGVIDVQMSQRLIDLANGRLDGYRDSRGVWIDRFYNLAALHDDWGFGKLAKVDTWRLRYGELIDVPLKDWPEAAVTYAKDDALATLRVHQAQQHFARYLKDSPAQARAAFALHLMSVRGIMTDPAACDAFLEETKEHLERCRELCVKAGLIRADGTKNTKAAKTRMESLCDELGVTPKLTKTGAISCDKEACRDTGDEVMKAYSSFTSADKTITNVTLLRKGATVPLQTSFVTMVSNGRTASREPSAPLIGTNFQNIPKTGKTRPCFIPRPGYYLCSVDYSMAELHTVSQVEIWIRKQSKLAEALNKKLDVHCVLASVMLNKPYEEVYAGRKGAYKEPRQYWAKPGNFGGWGLMSAKRFMAQTNREAQKKEARIDLPRAQWILDNWATTWEPEHYFDWVKSHLSHEGWGMGTIKQFISERIRAGVDGPAAANSFFSGLAADAGKAALLPLQYEARVDKASPFYGSFPLLYIHDEVIAEVPIERAHEAAHRMRDIMVTEFNKYVPDVPVRAEPALMTRWLKDAEPVYKDGELIPWDLAEAA